MHDHQKRAGANDYSIVVISNFMMSSKHQHLKSINIPIAGPFPCFNIIIFCCLAPCCLMGLRDRLRKAIPIAWEDRPMLQSSSLPVARELAPPLFFPPFLEPTKDDQLFTPYSTSGEIH